MASDEAPAAPDALPRGLVGFDERLADELFAFQRKAFPDRRLDWVEPRYRWMFVASAARLGVAPMVWLYRGKQGVVAHQGAIPVRVQIAGEERLTGWFVETMVLEEVRGRAIGPMLVAKAKNDLPFNLSLGQTAQMREMQFRLGWVQVAPLPTYAYVLDGGAVLRGRLPAPLVRLGGAALVMKQWFRSRRRSLDTRGLEARAVARFGSAHDDLWARLRPQFECAVVRDASYLNWKYCDQPGAEFERLEIVDGEERVVAIVVFRVLPADTAYRYTRAMAVEIIVPPQDPRVVSCALDALCRHARRAGAHLVVLDLLHPRLQTLVREFGFEARPATRYFLVSVDGLPEALKLTTLSPEKWLVTRGDSDIDRPW